MSDQLHQDREDQLHGGKVIPFPVPCNRDQSADWTALGVTLDVGLDLKAAFLSVEQELALSPSLKGPIP